VEARQIGGMGAVCICLDKHAIKPMLIIKRQVGALATPSGAYQSGMTHGSVGVSWICGSCRRSKIPGASKEP
jgi:hypothetical protein